MNMVYILAVTYVLRPGQLQCVSTRITTLIILQKWCARCCEQQY